MQTPFLALSYDQFVHTKKLFSFEREGVHSLPIFTDTRSAILFIRGMTKIIRELGDNRKLTTQLCSSPQHALDMLTTISALAPDLQQIIIDPVPPADPGVENMESETTEIVESLEDAIAALEKLTQSPSVE